ncbi:hypothetical protein [Bacillus sp. FJAT-45037]|uniref:hypothetical protein n=1 Tax=Bacillus sp. FJAT-45037 TaxID=2011007 RepID=UPI000C240C2E|nr:hypothetical protein [Bacillus sp. FJAT-45037]
MSFVKKTLKYFSVNRKKKQLDLLTVDNIKKQMDKEQFDILVIKEFTNIFEKRIDKYGQKHFKSWLIQLNYKIIEEFEDVEFTIEFYKKHNLWVEKEIAKLENEINLPWGVQSEDMNYLDDEIRKVHLVVRHRLTEIVQSLLDM